MPAARDITHLPQEEQAKILRTREIGRKSAARRDPAKVKIQREKRYKKLRELDKASPEWKALLASNTLFRSKNRERIRGYEAKALENPEHRLRRALRNRFKSAFKKGSKTGSAVRDLGCSVAELKERLESMFVSGMCWNNYGTVWHIDHIKPLASFDLSDREQFLAAVHFTNLQPLFAKDNLSKGSS